jgi:hypothetical protein
MHANQLAEKARVPNADSCQLLLKRLPSGSCGAFRRATYAWFFIPAQCPTNGSPVW